VAPAQGSAALRRTAPERREEASDDVLELAHSVGAEHHRLVLGDVVLLRRHGEDVERPQIGPAELLDLAVGAEDAGAIGAHVPLLADHAELDREPEDVGQELERLVGLDPLGGEPGLALDLGEARRGEQVAVADDLVDEIGLRRVERHRAVPDVLGRVEHAVAERAQEVAQRDQAGGGVVGPAGQGLQPLGDLVELRDVVDRELEPAGGLAEVGARVLLVLGRQLARDDPPDLVLGLGVLDARGGLAGLPGDGLRGDVVAPVAVDGIAGAGMVARELDGDRAVLVLGDRRVQLGFLEHVLPM
jgi:hypothetical protein